MDSRQVLRELRRAVEVLKAFNDVGRSLTSTLDPRQVLAIVTEKVGEMFRADAWTLLLADEVSGELEVQVAIGEAAGRLLGTRLPLGAGITGWVASSAHPVLIDDARADARFSLNVDPAPSGAPRSFMAVPLRTAATCIGALALCAREGERFSADELRTLSALADYTAIALSNARNFEKVRELTVLDDHTALYNSRHLYRVLEAESVRAVRYRRPLSVIFFDLDLFKQVNDAYGHQAGSDLLREVGQLLRALLRATDVPVRYGGDEFVVILPETTREQAAAVAGRLRDALQANPFLRSRDLAVSVTASFGIATWPEDGETGEDLLRAADAAMYRAKGAGRNAIAVGNLAPR